MSEQQLWEAIRELTNLVVVQRSDLEALQERVKELEQQIPDPLWAEKEEADIRVEWG